MPCHADRSVQLLIRRELQRRVDGLNAIGRAHMARWAAQNRMPGPRMKWPRRPTVGHGNARTSVNDMHLHQ